MSTKNPDAGKAVANRTQESRTAARPPEDPEQPKSEPSGAAAEAGPAARESAGPDRRWLPRLILGILVLCGAGAAYSWYQIAHRSPDESRLDLQGNIDVRQVQLSFKVAGRIETLAVDEGDAVAADNVIATLDKSYFDDDLRLARARRANATANLARLEHGSRPEEIGAARAQVAQQRATVARAKRDYARAEELVGTGAVSRETFDQAKAALEEAEARLEYAEQSLQLVEIGPRQEDIDAARAQLASQEAEVVQSERRLADRELRAPAAGIILTRAREKGAIVAAGETVFTLTLASPVWVRTYVNERDLGRIRPGMPAGVRTDSDPDKIYRATIGFISPTAEFTPKTVETRELRTDLVYRLRVVVDNPDGGLRQGMPVTVSLELGK
jgi:HlyD family secretion protein